MSGSLTLYSILNVSTLEKIVESFQEEFNTLLEDCFSDEELRYFEKDIDAISAIYVQPIFSELSFDDFNPKPEEEQKQRFFFETCRSSILLENLPYFESNPFQVTYLLELLKRFDEVLIDRGGMNELMFKGPYVGMLKSYKSMDQVIPSVVPKKPEIKSSAPVDPIDFLIMDVYREVERTAPLTLPVEELSPKVQKIYSAMKLDRMDSTDLLKASGLNAKDFDDGLERLKFWLKKY